jgi:hypothetical protein
MLEPRRAFNRRGGADDHFGRAGPESDDGQSHQKRRHARLAGQCGRAAHQDVAARQKDDDAAKHHQAEKKDVGHEDLRLWRARPASALVQTLVVDQVQNAENADCEAESDKSCHGTGPS